MYKEKNVYGGKINLFFKSFVKYFVFMFSNYFFYFFFYREVCNSCVVIFMLDGIDVIF